MLRISVKSKTFGNHPSVNSSTGGVFRVTEIDHDFLEALSASATVFALEGGVCGSTALGRERLLGDLDRSGAVDAIPLGPSHHHIDVAAAASEQTSRLPHSGTAVSARYRWAISAGSGSARWPHALHHTISRTRAAAALPSVMGGPGGVFFRRSARHLCLVVACGAPYLLRWRGISHHLGTVPSRAARSSWLMPSHGFGFGRGGTGRGS
jgi:hypothetical protein